MKLAAALSGGGSKGAFEIGVWRSMLEHGLSCDLVVGTSIGSLNGALMAQGDYEAAKALWDGLDIHMVMEDGVNLEYSIQRMLDKKDEIIPFLKKYVHYKGADIGPLRELIGRAIHEDQVRASRVDFGLVTLQVPSMQALTLKPWELLKGDIPEGRMGEYLLASASCFPAFPMCKIDGKTFIDGGYHDNLPIAFALRSGADHVVAVDLDCNIHHKFYWNQPYVTYIKPSWNLGSILLFEHDVMERNMTLGYNDAQKVLGSWFGFRYTFADPDASSDFAKEALRFAAGLGKLEAELAFSQKSALIKSGPSPLTAGLAEWTFGKRMTAFDLLTRSVELGAELLEIDHLKVYTLRELAGLVQRALDEGKEQAGELVRKLESIKLPSELLSALRPASPRELLCCAARVLEDAKDAPETLIWLASSLPREMAAVMGSGMLCGQAGGSCIDP